MKSSDVRLVLKSRCAKMERHRTALLEDFDPEEIHQFRLHTKKLNAFLHLLNADRTKEKELKPGKYFGDFYRVVGELRNLQLHRNNILQLCGKLKLLPPQGYLKGIAQQEGKVKIEARRIALKASLHKCCHKLIDAAPHQVSESAVENFVADYKHRLLKILLASAFCDEELHSLRKLLKHVIYLWPWMKDEITSLPNSACIDKGSCLSICESLGDSQDRCTALRFLNAHAVVERLGMNDVFVLPALRKHLQNEKEYLKRELVAEFRLCIHRMWETDVLLPIYKYL